MPDASDGCVLPSECDGSLSILKKSIKEKYDESTLCRSTFPPSCERIESACRRRLRQCLLCTISTQSGFKAIYLSGGGVAACSCGIPDLGITTMEDVLIDARRITDNVDTPLMVDIDVGWGGAFNIARTIRNFERAGVAAVHIEDQVAQKRCSTTVRTKPSFPKMKWSTASKLP